MVVLELIFYNSWTACGVLGALVGGGLFAVSRVGAEPRRKARHRKVRGASSVVAGMKSVGA